MLGRSERRIVLGGQHVQRGMSMIEILIGIAIIGVLAAVALPAIGDMMRNIRIRNGAEAVLNGLQFARAEAVKQNRVVAFQLTDASNANYRVCVWDMATNDCSATLPDLKTFSSGDGSSRVRVAADTSSAAPYNVMAAGAGVPGRVGFSGFGRLTNPGTDLQRVDVFDPTVSAAEQRRMVILISTGGQVRLCDPAVALASNPRGCA